jgi:hypothetical protein
MRISVCLLVLITALCEAQGPFKLLSLPPSTEDSTPRTPTTLAILLKNEYVRALALIDGIYCVYLRFFISFMAGLTVLAAPEKSNSSSRWPSNQLINGGLYIADIAAHGRNYVISKPARLTMRSTDKAPPLLATPAPSEGTSEGAQSLQQTAAMDAKISDRSASTNGPSTAGPSVVAKINALGALLVFVGAVFTLL